MREPVIRDAAAAVKLVSMLTNEARGEGDQEEMDLIVVNLEPEWVSGLLDIARSEPPGMERLVTSCVVSISLGLSRGSVRRWFGIKVFIDQLMSDQQFMQWVIAESQKIVDADQNTVPGLTTWIESHLAWGVFVGRRFKQDD